MLLECHIVSAGSHDLQRLQARGPDLSPVPGQTETRGQAVLRRAAAGQGAHPLPVQLRGLPGGAHQGEHGLRLAAHQVLLHLLLGGLVDVLQLAAVSLQLSPALVYPGEEAGAGRTEERVELERKQMAM